MTTWTPSVSASWVCPRGGIETYLTAAADPRIAAAVPFIGAESFRYALDHDLWSHRTETIPVALSGAAKDAGVARVDATTSSANFMTRWHRAFP